MQSEVKIYDNLEELLQSVNKTKEEIRESKILNVPFRVTSLNCCKQIVSEFPHLKSLDINTGQMDDAFMKEISKLADLRELDVSANHISNNGVKFLSNLKHMERLDLSLCDINDGCLDDIIKMEELKALYLSGTDISIFSLHKLETLKKLKDCDFRRADCANSLPDELVNQRDMKRILEYVKTKTDAKVPVGNHRIILLGEPTAGKTALFNKLCGYEYYRTTSTLGVNIQAYSPRSLEGDASVYNSLRGFNVWDFGGQITQGTIHNMFLSDNCLFAIVLEPRMNDCERDFLRWYRSIRQYIKKSNYNLPLLVVFSKCDNENGGVGNSFDLNSVTQEIENRIRNELYEEEQKNGNSNYIDLQFVKSSSITKDGLNQLLSVIDEILKKANALDRLNVSEYQKKLLSALINTEKETDTFFIDYNTIKKCANDIYGEVVNDRQIISDLKVLSKFGDLFYHDHLGKIGVFVNPSKVSAIVYEILIGHNKMKDLFDVNSKTINEIFELNNEQIARAILLFLKAKNLVFEKSMDTFCIPSRLGKMPFDFPRNTLKECKGVRHFVFQFKPDVVGMSWKIASQLYNRQKIKQDEEYYFDDEKIFRDGFLVQMTSDDYGDELAVVKENSKENRLDVWVTRSIVDKLGGLWAILKREIPDCLVGDSHGDDTYVLSCVCPCKGRWGDECSHTHLYKNIENNLTHTICTESNKLINPRNFLYDSGIGYEEVAKEKKKIYVIMPFDVPENENFYDEIKETLKDVYEDYKAYIEEPFICRNPEYTIETIDEKMRQNIINSNIIITILDNRNLNVYFEFGLAMAYDHLRKITFINESDFDKRPFNIEHFTLESINYNNIKDFKLKLTKHLEQIIKS